jgi:hypothetical protein
MEWGAQYRRAGILVLIGCITLVSGMICGCVEVTPPAGSINASSYGTAGSSGNLTSGLDNRTTTQEPSTSGNSAGQNPTQGEQINSGMDAGQLTPPEAPVVRVTPRSLQGLPTALETQSYSAKSDTSAIGPTAEFITIFDINHSFINDAVAYAYTVEKPPLYIDLKFAPVNETHVISFQKRTGDKEGQVDVTVNRPLKDAWFELRVYNQMDGKEVLSEGYGRTYSQSNKTVVLRNPGSYQFDLLGNFVNASIVLKVPVSSSSLAQYQNITSLINTTKQDANLIPTVFLTRSDLSADWNLSGDASHTDTQYRSVFMNTVSGQMFEQTIKRYASTEAANAALADLKIAVASDNPAATLIGQGGFQFESVRKTEIAFHQGSYLVELVSYSVPALTLTDLQQYGAIIVSRVNVSG